MYSRVIVEALLLVGLCALATVLAWAATVICKPGERKVVVPSEAAEEEDDDEEELEDTLLLGAEAAKAAIASAPDSEELPVIENAPGEPVAPNKNASPIRTLCLDQYNTKRSAVALNALVRTALDDFGGAMAEKKLSSTFDALSNEITADVDPCLLECIVCALLSNAVKSSVYGGNIRVGVSYRNNRFCIAVQDSGTGMTPEEVKTVLSPDHEPAGGRGDLVIAKEIAEMLGGSIIVLSERGKQTLVTVDIEAPQILGAPEPVGGAEPVGALHVVGAPRGNAEARPVPEQTAELETKIGELETQLAMKNQELRWLARELKIARDVSVTAAQTKSTFLSNMSHEIRTPLNGLIATGELLMQTALSDEQRELLQIANESAFSLLETINDLLDYSRIENGTMNLDLVNFDLLAMVEGAASLLSTRAQHKHLSLMTYISSDVPRRVLGDPARLRQVLINLLSNAVKFTEQGEVVCRVTLEKEMEARTFVRFSVQDTGTGMSSELQERLFEPFSQADPTLTRKTTGTGLGLSIARRLVQLMGGELGFESTEGSGSLFWFIMPFEHRTASDQWQGMPKSQIKPVRVLVIEPNLETQQVLMDYCTAWKFSCATVDSAREGLASLSRNFGLKKPFDVVLVDFDVADMHPFTLARYMKNSPELCDTRMILMSSTDEPGRGERAVKNGFGGYLLKPIKQSHLFDCIAELIEVNRNDTIDCNVPPVNAVPSRTIDASAIDESQKPLVLLVEDNRVNQRVASLQLQDLGCRVHVVNNGSEALDAVSRQDYDLILMDCAMPVLDGYAATSEIRKQDALSGKHTKVVALTAHALHDDRERCLAAGMDDYLTKPISVDELRSALGKWLKLPVAREVT